MVANKITFEQTATNEISLCVETSFGFEVLVLSTQQAEQLAEGLRKTVSAMPSRFLKEKTGFLGVTYYALKGGFSGT